MTDIKEKTDGLEGYTKLILSVKRIINAKPPVFDGLYRLMLKANRQAKELGLKPPYSRNSLKEVKARDKDVFSNR